MVAEALSVERIQDARKTLIEAAKFTWGGGFPGAIGQDDPASAFVEAKRNLTALILPLHGEAEWMKVIDSE